MGPSEAFPGACHPADTQLYRRADGTVGGGMDCGLNVSSSMAKWHYACTTGRPDGVSGPWRPRAREFRDFLDDFDGGTNLSQNALVLAAWYRVDMALRMRESIERMWKEIEAGYFISLSGNTNALRVPYVSFASANHQVGVHGFGLGARAYRRIASGPFAGEQGVCFHDPGYDGRRAGIPVGPQVVPVAMINRFAGALTFPGYVLRDRFPGRAYWGRSPQPVVTAEPGAQSVPTAAPARRPTMFAVTEADRPPRKIFVQEGAPLLEGADGERATRASRAGFVDFYGKRTTGGVPYVIVNVRTKALDGTMRRIGGLWIRAEFTGEVRSRGGTGQPGALEAAEDEAVAEPLEVDPDLVGDEAAAVDAPPSDDDVAEDEAALGPLTLPDEQDR